MDMPSSSRSGSEVTDRPGTLVVVAMETLWPPNHGGRVDRWNRYRLLKQLGWRLIFVGWTQNDQAMAAEHDAAMAEIFDRCFFFPNRLTLASLTRRLLLLYRHSPHMSARMISSGRRRALVSDLRMMKPDAVMMDGLYGTELGLALARDLGLPLFYRSHNIEHRYMADQAAAAHGVKRKMAATLAALHLERAETQVMRTADWVFDISADDMRFWAGRDVTRSSWLPPLTLDVSNKNVERTIAWNDRPFDIAYLGNLNTPNNVEGLAWFLQSVLPILRQTRPDISVLLAGSNPSPQMRALAEGQAGVSLVPNPEDGDEVRRNGRILVNPVLRGSGVNVKSVEMLMTDSPVVTTSIGVQGLDDDTRRAFAVSDDPAEFAHHIDTNLDAGPVADEDRQVYRQRFGMGAAEALSEKLRTLIVQRRERA